LTNAEFAKTNTLFRIACNLCNNVERLHDGLYGWHKLASKRQASKFRNKKGIVYLHKEAAKIIEKQLRKEKAQERVK
jgi:hypothetical protein